jgi:hypothetical protein
MWLPNPIIMYRIQTRPRSKYQLRRLTLRLLSGCFFYLHLMAWGWLWLWCRLLFAQPYITPIQAIVSVPAIGIFWLTRLYTGRELRQCWYESKTAPR